TSGLDLATSHWSPEAAAGVQAARDRLAEAGIAWQGCEAAFRYPWLGEVVAEATIGPGRGDRVTTTDRIDRVLTHRTFGPLIFFGLMALVFQSIYAWAAPLMDLIDGATVWAGDVVRGAMAPGVLTDLLVDGIITGVGSVVIFLPQIVLLFLFMALLEDTGYMARAAFVMDRIMSKVGLHGRSFVPLLSSFACAIPGIMAARTIASKRDRLATILVAPLITCSARLPVYVLLISAFVPRRPLLGGVLNSQGLVLFSLYLMGIASALLVAAVLKRTILRGPTPVLLLELPSYRRPTLRHLLHDLWERAWLFLRFAGSVILSLSIVLWFLAYFPRADVSNAPELARQQVQAAGGDPSDEAAVEQAAAVIAGSRQLEQSAMGRLGKVIEPVVRPLGFDWRLGVGLLGAFAAREVMVSTLGIIFAVSDEADEQSAPLIQRLRTARRDDGSLLFTPPVVASLLVFFVFACQCMSTVGIVVRETGGWKWAGFMLLYMSLLAYVLSFSTYQVMRAAGA
ncbi:MAG: ferrous iron transport protein B, partial [Armatimonadetes bacterium]|nr:ferrous iron transport protein B [Armatimonadota bacterium]